MKSTALLKNLQKQLTTNQSLRKETAQKLASRVVFEVTSKDGQEWWALNARDPAAVELTRLDGKDAAAAGKADIGVKVDDNNLRKLIRGKQSAQRLYMSGKLKIKGNVMKAAYIEKLLKFAGPANAKL